MWSVNGEEGREKKLLNVPWVKTQDIMCHTPETTDRISIAEATLKVGSFVRALCYTKD